eukprot:Gb_02164 [translate_table: standard]
MSKHESEDTPAKPTNIELREHDDLELQQQLKEMPEQHPCNIALQNAELRDFFLMPNLFFNTSVVVDVVKLVTLQVFKVSIQMVYEVTGLPYGGPRAISGVANGTKYNWCAYMRARMQTNLTKIAEATRQASFFMPTIFIGLLLHKFKEIQLLVPQGIPKFPKLQAWTEVYGCRKASGVVEGEEVRPLVMTTPHGQRLESQQIEDAEEKQRNKGKFTMIDEVVVHEELEVCPQPSPMIETLACNNQVPIPPLPDYLNKMLSLEWPKSIPDGHIRLNYEDRWKVFEEDLDKQDCELFNHEQWHPAFTANVIKVLVRDLV